MRNSPWALKCLSCLSYFLWLENREDRAGGRLAGWGGNFKETAGEERARLDPGLETQGWCWPGKEEQKGAEGNEKLESQDGGGRGQGGLDLPISQHPVGVRKAKRKECLHV